MKKIVIVNNNLKVGGVQKSLVNFLWATYKEYEITLVLFNRRGEYTSQIPEEVNIIECSSLYTLLGKSQSECSSLVEKLVRGFLAFGTRVFGRSAILRIINLSQPEIKDEYDVAISYLQNGNIRHFYGGVNEFVLQKIRAKKKVAFLHCDYLNCGANHPKNNRLYYQFDNIIACSDGCRDSFAKAVPELASHCVTVKNFHRHEFIKAMATQNSVVYSCQNINIVIVGRLAHEKAVDRAIKAVCFVRNQSLPVTLHIIGSGAMENALRDLVNRNDAEDYIYFWGEQSNPYKFMKNADLLLVTSYHEAAPMVIDEARIIGLPTLTVETTSSEEMILPYSSGWICHNDQDAINLKLLELTNKPGIIELVKTELLKEEFDNEIALKQLQDVMKKS